MKNTDAARPGAAPAFSSEALAAVLRRLDLTPATPLKIAYSGGLDSHVLLHALSRLRDDGWRLSALHADHGLQPAAGAWARHCEQVCRELALPITIERIEVRGIREHGLEAAARRARYACLARHVGPGEVLLTAHHQDDQAETLLLQLLRGSGVHGLAAMPAIAAFAAGRHARPLLEFPRRALLAYATAAGLKWIEDDSNRDDRLARNFIRNRLTPVIEERWPGAARRLGRSARHAAEAAALLDEIARADLRDCAAGAGAVSLPALLRLAPARQRNLIRLWIRARGLRPPAEIVLEQILEQARRTPRTRHAAVRWPEAEIRRYRDTLVLLAPPAGPESPLALPWDPAAPLDIPALGARLRAVPAVGAGLARARIGPNLLTVRLRRGGESCRLPGREHHHKLKKLFQEAGVPPWERRRLPLIYVNDDLAAIGDRWVCEPYAARADEPGLVLILETAAARGA
ncbi:MAG: tRNA lysidine(34) synthetase TilS [Candidatus Muproteobacteria bacterium RIFCSPHIGHO2_02_FULL_65_16]|uniref:tRNA(Ile)-lysidine synthase n=1 Tax=Candidatus Muproteobacteria bacterium RIFCSPHIGHO2_02_FULL_65_16 TaxID=1817766 RepID=A0A1F6U554_9PROT|nr:MAG: tRNA lysidine(34) synthetase TilS [Candidatus Muproteobacteria bacterium RIFCSPHIGHO2_02_FULL_65_16]